MAGPALESAAQRGLFRGEASVPHGSAAVSLSLLAVAVLGIGQALLIALIVGESDRTDAFFAAYSLYAVFALLATTMRASVIPLLGHPESDPDFVERCNAVLSRVGAVSLALGGGLLLLAPIAGQLVTLGLSSEDRWFAVFALALLAPAACLQILAAAQSAVLNAAHRFHYSAGAYVVSAAIGLAVSAWMLSVVGAIGSALGLLSMALVQFCSHYLYVRRFKIRLRVHGHRLWDDLQRRVSVTVGSGAAIAVTIQLTMAIALGVLSSSPSAITAYSYAFLFVTTLLVITTFALGLTTMARLVAALSARGTAAASDYLLRVVPHAFAVLVPALLGFATCGHALLELVFGSSLTQSTIDLLYELGLILSLMTVPASVVYACWTIVLAQHRSNKFLSVAIATIAIQFVLAVALSGFGARAVAAGNVVAIAVMSALMLRVSIGHGWATTCARVLWHSAPALALSLVFVVARLPFGADIGAAAAIVILLLSSLAYVGLAIALWPAVSRSFIGLVRMPGVGHPG